METKTKMLIAVGAAFTANCQPCLRTVIKKALDNGAEKKEIAEAIGVAKVLSITTRAPALCASSAMVLISEIFRVGLVGDSSHTSFVFLFR